MSACLCTAEGELECAGGGLPRRGAYCSCRCHAQDRIDLRAGAIADVHAELRDAGALPARLDMVLHVAWLKEFARDPEPEVLS